MLEARAATWQGNGRGINLLERNFRYKLKGSFGTNRGSGYQVSCVWLVELSCKPDSAVSTKIFLDIFKRHEAMKCVQLESNQLES